jgi:hypothetical protein
MFEIMKRKDIIRQIIIVLAGAVLTTACSSSDKEEVTPPAKRTVMVYMAAENSLSSYAQQDINEMIDGVKSISKWDNLIVFVDRASTREKPFIIRLRDDKNAPADTIRKYEQDFVSSDPERMKEVLSWMMSNYPADDYGLVMWGHANGWVIMDANRRALAVDTGNNSTSGAGVWLELPDFRKVLEALPHPLKFVFADCCNVQNLEVAYELKDVIQYLIASPAAIPGTGAPYKMIVPDLFTYDDNQLCDKVCTDYHDIVDNENGHLPIAAIRTSAMPQLAAATKKILKSIYETNTPINVDGLIYYYRYSYKPEENVMYDINDFLLRHAQEADYQEWLTAFNAAVVCKKMSKKWEVQGGLDFDFGEITEERFGGVSMFIPLERYENTMLKYNTLIKQTAWYQAVGWSELGW